MSHQNNLVSEIIDWNLKFPLDRWWREKYKISFRSKLHLEQCQYDIYLEYVETIMFDNLSVEKENQYKPGYNDIFKESVRPDITSLDDIIFNKDGSITL